MWEKDEKKNEYTYSAKINLINGGNYGYTFRAMPKHEMMLEYKGLWQIMRKTWGFQILKIFNNQKSFFCHKEVGVEGQMPGDR